MHHYTYRHPPLCVLQFLQIADTERGIFMSASDIKRKALQLGFDSCGIIPAIVFDEYKQYLDERAQTFPESKELYDNFHSFATPPGSAKSIIVCLERLGNYKIPDSLNGLIGKNYQFDSRVVSYSYEQRARAEFMAYLKLAGCNVLEYVPPSRWAAAKAGLGKFGHNNFIYSPEHGSYVRIAAWAVDKELEYDMVPEELVLPECSNCQKCVRACPVNALSDSLSMDMSKCISYRLHSSEDILDNEVCSQLGRWIYGCDICQDICPVNKGKLTGDKDFPLLAEFEEYLQPENLLTMSEDVFNNIVNPRFPYISKDDIWRWRCNALRSMINSGNEEYHRIILEQREHEDERVREIAKWGCRVLGL